MMTEIKQKYRRIPNADTGAIRILDEKYKDIAVSIGRVSFGETESEEGRVMGFDYDIVMNERNIEIDEDFDTLLGDIIVDIIETKLETDPDSLKFDDNEN